MKWITLTYRVDGKLITERVPCHTTEDPARRIVHTMRNLAQIYDSKPEFVYARVPELEIL